MSPALSVVACGPTATLQDGGRHGWQRFGVSVGGAMDPLALAVANALVGNTAGACAIELLLLGGRFMAEDGPVRVAVAGADVVVKLDGRPLEPCVSAVVAPGQVIEIGGARRGVVTYLAVAGGLTVPPVLGSRSLLARAALGGVEGRSLRPGDRLPVGDAPTQTAAASFGPDHRLDPPPLEPDAPVRVILGPQDDHFTDEAIATFLAEPFTVTQETDRMGMRLAGPPIAHRSSANIVSDGTVAGSIQVPGSGQPIVLLADRQTTGGYPKIATVISADVRRLAHRRPGDPVRFAAITVAEAQAVARQRAADIRSLPSRLSPIRPDILSLEALAAAALSGRAVSALDPTTWEVDGAPHPLP